ncbi:MAG: DUF2071 domain-containing protein [Bacteroidetes bacterium]|nr:DUF2071 domain-containing protein [Bacteroidota bacterium]
MSSPFLTAEWRKLALANYAIDPSLLKPWLPAHTELDPWQGTHYVSLVGFRFINTRLKGLAIPFHRHFEEVNLRFYVRAFVNGEWRRGVCFIREIVPRFAISWVANRFYKERYVCLPMKHTWQIDQQKLTVEYAWKHAGQWDEFLVNAINQPQSLVPGSKTEFITEHYWGYSRMDADRTTQYEVQHPSWLIYPVDNYAISVRFGQLYGDRFAVLEKQTPASVMLAEGSTVAVLGKSVACF